MAKNDPPINSATGNAAYMFGFLFVGLLIQLVLIVLLDGMTT